MKGGEQSLPFVIWRTSRSGRGESQAVQDLGQLEIRQNQSESLNKMGRPLDHHRPAGTKKQRSSDEIDDKEGVREGTKNTYLFPADDEEHVTSVYVKKATWKGAQERNNRKFQAWLEVEGDCFRKWRAHRLLFGEPEKRREDYEDHVLDCWCGADSLRLGALGSLRVRPESGF